MTQEPIMLKWYTCEGCGRPAPWAMNGCTAVCGFVADKVAEGMDPHNAARAHLAPGYALPPAPQGIALRDMEALLRQISSDLWVMTVDNPETATLASEAAGMTPERAALREVYVRIDGVVTSIEDLINDTSEEV